MTDFAWHSRDDCVRGGKKRRRGIREWSLQEVFFCYACAYESCEEETKKKNNQKYNEINCRLR